MAQYLRHNPASGSALLPSKRLSPILPPRWSALRRQDLSRDLPLDAVERFFALGFALEQLRRNFNDLECCIAEISARADWKEPQASAR